jgi:hypothetical protein
LPEAASDEPWHFHVADDEVVVFVGGAFQGFAAVEQSFDVQAFVFQYVADEARDSGLIFDDKHSRAGPRSQRRIRGSRRKRTLRGCAPVCKGVACREARPDRGNGDGGRLRGLLRWRLQLQVRSCGG